MPAKPNARNWKDVQTAIAAVSTVLTLGMWELFATPVQAQAIQTPEPVLPPSDPPVAAEPTALPPVKIIFTPMATQVTTIVHQPQQAVQKKKKKKNNNGGSNSVTQTHTS